MAKTKEQVKKMTPDEVWNYVQNQDAQRDDALTQIAELDSIREIAATVETLQKERDEIKSRYDELLQEKPVNDAIKAERDALAVKVAAMAAHPDVIAADKAKKISAARELRKDAILKRQQAEAELTAIGAPFVAPVVPPAI